MAKIGDISKVESPDGLFIIRVEVLAVADDGRILKARAIEPFPELGKIGFFMEEDDWVIFEIDIDTPN